MAHEYTTWVYKQDISGAGRKFVLIALADIADENGYAFPGQKRLTRMTGQSERSVRQHLEWLVEHGYLKREQRRRKDGTRTSDAYFLPEKDSTGSIRRWPATGENRRQSEKAAEPDQDDQTTATSTGKSRRLSTGKSRQTNRQISPKSPAESAGHELPGYPPEEPTPLPPKGGSGAKAPRSSRRKTKKPKQHEFNPLDPDLELPDSFDRELFADYCARLLEIGKPMTILALRHFIEAHQHHPQATLDEMFRRSIRAGWPDLYPLDRPSNSTPEPPPRPKPKTAEGDWRELLRVYKTGRWNTNTLSDAGKAALDAIGGWTAIYADDPTELETARQEFLQHHALALSQEEAAA